MLKGATVVFFFLIIAWQVYQGVTVQELGVSWLFTVKFSSDAGATDPRRDAVLELVAVDVITDQDAATATLDIKVRNTGDEVAFIHRVEFTIESYAALTPSGMVIVSGTYEAGLPTFLTESDLPHTLTVPVSQSVDPSGATALDRFELVVGAEGPLLHRYGFAVRLLYNETEATSMSETLEVVLQGQVD